MCCARSRGEEGRARLRFNETRSQCGYGRRGRLASRGRRFSAPKKIMNSKKKKSTASSWPKERVVGGKRKELWGEQGNEGEK